MHSDPIVRRLHACVLALVPCCLWSDPGAGKTARVTAYAKARALPLERWLLSRCEPIDLKPRIYDAGRVIVADPPEIERLTQAGRGILFVDELNRAARETEGAALDRIDTPPAGVSVIAACNPPARGQAARSLESAAANRFCHIELAADSDAFANGLVGGWATSQEDLPVPNAADVTRETDSGRALASAFLRRRGELVEKQPDNPVQAGRAWPSPRTWEHAIRLFGVARALAYSTEDLSALLAGCVGAGPAVEFLAYAADVDLPDPEELLAHPGSYTPPRGRVDKTIAALTAVCGAVRRDPTDTRWRAAWALVQACVDADQADAGMVAGSMLIPIAGVAKGLTTTHKLMPQRLAVLLTSARGK
jgi:hypothetical protein